MPAKKELRIGVIGAGGRGSLVRHAHCPEKGVRVVAGADTNPAALEKFKTDFGPDVFVTDDYRRLLALKDVGAVFITSPDFLHEEHALAALKAGKAVYLEKPMAITIEGCDRILRAAFERKAKLFLGHNMRHMRFTRAMRELILKGAIGQVKVAWCRHFVGYGGDAYFKDWHAERRQSTSLLLQKGAHDIDILHWLCGGFTERVNAMGGLTVYGQIKDRRAPAEPPDTSWSADRWPPLSQKGMNPIMDVEDVSMMLMQLDNGVFASYQQCHFAPDGWRNYTIIGTEGRIENVTENCVKLWNRRIDGSNLFGDEQFYLPPARGGHGGADQSIVAEFVAHVRFGKKVTTSPVAARHSVAAGCMAAHSMRHGGIPMNIPKTPPKLVAYFNASLARV